MSESTQHHFQQLEVRFATRTLLRETYVVRFELEDEALVYGCLARHGCEVAKSEGCTRIVFPEGTVIHEQFPRVNLSRYTVVLPDGYALLLAEKPASPLKMVSIEFPT